MVLYQAGKLNLPNVIYDNIYSDTIKTIFLKIIDLSSIHNQSYLYFLALCTLPPYTCYIIINRLYGDNIPMKYSYLQAHIDL